MVHLQPVRFYPNRSRPVARAIPGLREPRSAAGPAAPVLEIEHLPDGSIKKGKNLVKLIDMAHHGTRFTNVYHDI